MIHIPETVQKLHSLDPSAYKTPEQATHEIARLAFTASIENFDSSGDRKKLPRVRQRGFQQIRTISDIVLRAVPEAVQPATIHEGEYTTDFNAHGSRRQGTAVLNITGPGSLRLIARGNYFRYEGGQVADLYRRSNDKSQIRPPYELEPGEFGNAAPQIISAVLLAGSLDEAALHSLEVKPEAPQPPPAAGPRT